MDEYVVGYPGELCDNEVPQHVCDPCAETEKGRLRAVAYINKSVVATIQAAPSDTAAWQAGIQAGTIRVIPEVLGSWNGGDPVTGTGYGDSKDKTTGRNCEANFKDPNYADNCSFYSELEKSRNWHLAFKSETMIHISAKPVTVFAKNPLTENLDDDVVWDVRNTWFQKAPVCPETAPDGIFDCFSLTAE